MSQDTTKHNSSPEAESSPKSPVVAGLLAIIPGAGHYYLGQRSRGIIIFIMAFVMAVLLYWSVTTTDINWSSTSVTNVIKAMFAGSKSISEINIGSVFLEIIPFDLAVLFWIWQIIAAVTNARGRKFFPSAGLALLLVFAYILGWQATDINLAKLFTPSPNTLDIFVKIVWPWDAAIERQQNLAVATTDFANPCPDNVADAPSQVRGDGSKTWIVVDPPCGEFTKYDAQTATSIPGTQLTLTGGGFQPGKKVDLWWQNSLGQYFKPMYSGETRSVMADQNGNITLTFNAPQESNETKVGVNIHHIEMRQLISEGKMRLTSNFELALSRILVTIFQALMATSLGLILAIPASFLASRNLMFGSPGSRVVYYSVRFVMNVVRSIEPFIWAVIATVWVGLGPFAGVMALTLHTIASLGKLYSEAIESIEPGPIEAITATGANRLQTIVYGIIPQVIPPFLSFTIYRWDINVRMATIIGLVGGGGIGQVLFQWINQNLWREAGMAAWLITITVTAMDNLSSELRKRFI